MVRGEGQPDTRASPDPPSDVGENECALLAVRGVAGPPGCEGVVRPGQERHLGDDESTICAGTPVVTPVCPGRVRANSCGPSSAPPRHTQTKPRHARGAPWAGKIAQSPCGITPRRHRVSYGHHRTRTQRAEAGHGHAGWRRWNRDLSVAAATITSPCVRGLGYQKLVMLAVADSSATCNRNGAENAQHRNWRCLGKPTVNAEPICWAATAGVVRGIASSRNIDPAHESGRPQPDAARQAAGATDLYSDAGHHRG